ncbi:MAG: RDD family protein [Campylobacterota bacterium]|nr:RDD family protein [Campylobacterota bacterium]
MENSDNLELAPMRARLQAFIIDDFLITLLVIVILWDSISGSGGDVIALLTLLNEYAVPVIVLKIVYQILFVWYYGATLGKMVAKIRVVDYDHFGRVSLMNAIFRSLGRILSEMFFYIGFIMGYFTDGRQTFHDKIGKTLVINA